MDFEHSGGFWEGELGLRQEGNRRRLFGKFPYGATATISDRGSVRKERMLPHAFRWSAEVARPLAEAIQEDLDLARLQRVDLLTGHDFNRPIASTWTGSLQLRDTAAALEFVADLPEPARQPSWMVDTLLAVESEQIPTGISLGFRVPPRSAGPDAERLVPEEGNPGVQFREIREGTLFELSVVTRAAYRETEFSLRADLQARGDDQLARFWALGGIL